VNPDRAPRPDWLKVRAPSGKRVEEVSGTLARHGLRTVCREARCPNVGECWGAGTATVILLGDVCTRGCAFCGVRAGEPAPPDPSEPDRVAKAAAELSWRHVVVTSVTRDDLPDGGAGHFASVVRALRREAPGAAVELLIPDFAGNVDALRRVVDSAPDILAHNVETVPRLYPAVRKGASFGRSVDLFRRAAAMRPSLPLKSGIMVGFGETEEEVAAVFRDLFDAGCRSITIGQYLPPSRDHLPLAEYVPPDRFERFADSARRIGFDRVLSGPLVRSSYHPQPRA
jgi:lipoic acid synthetase